jgi:nucleoid DNA-binding protein
MALKVTVSTGKHETSRPAGLLRRTEGGAESTDKTQSGNVTVTDVVEAVFSQVRASIEKEADVELEFTANVEIVNKDGETSLNLDLSGESPNARTMRLKFTTKVNPKDEAKG